MGAKWNKFTEKVKKILKDFWDLILLVGSALFGILAFLACKKINDENVKKKNWKRVYNDDTSILIKRGKGYEKVKLPKIEGKQIKADDIKVVGITKEGRIAAKIRHIKTNRHIDSYIDNDFHINSGMDL